MTDLIILISKYSPNYVYLRISNLKDYFDIRITNRINPVLFKLF